MKFIYTHTGLYIAPTNEYRQHILVSTDGLTNRLVTRNDLFQSFLYDVEEKLWEEYYEN